MKRFLLPALLAVSVSGASYADASGVVTFGCNNHKYAVTIQNLLNEPEACTVSCKSKFHAETSTVYVNPNGTTIVYGTFGMSPTVCDVACAGPTYGARPTVQVGGHCLL